MNTSKKKTTTTTARRHSATHPTHLEPGDSTMKKEDTPQPATPPPPTPPPNSGIDFAALQSGLAAVLAAFGPNATPMSIDERRRLAKMKPGGDAYTGVVMAALQEHGIVLPDIDPTAVAEDMALVQALAPIVQQINVIQTLVADRSRAASSRIWRATTTAYRVLARTVRTRPSLQVQLGPIASFLAVRFKDAPASLRPRERKALAKARQKRKADGTPPGTPTGQSEPTPGPKPPVEETPAPKPAPGASS
jgi:hypothetical protein